MLIFFSSLEHFQEVFDENLVECRSTILSEIVPQAWRIKLAVSPNFIYVRVAVS